jgi:pilus assembly protein Flp/PilA
MKFFKRFRTDESGATAIEYGLIAALIAVALMSVVHGLGNQTNSPSQAAAPVEQPLGK